MADFEVLIPLIGISYLIVKICISKYCISFLDPIWIQIISISISIGNLTLLYVYNYINIYQYIKVAFLIGVFLFGIKITSLFFNEEKFILRLKEMLKKEPTSTEEKFFLAVYFLHFIALFIFVVMLNGSGMGDERIVLGKEYRILDIVKNGSGSLVYLVGLILYEKKQDIKKIYMLIILLILSGFSGSKSFALNIISSFLFVKGIKEYGEYKNYKNRAIKCGKNSLILVSIILSSIFVLVYWGKSVEEAYMTMLMRIFFASDTYLYAFVYGDYTEFYGEYSVLPYLLHPFLKMMGMQGYDFPLGAKLFTLIAGNREEGFGPNPQLPILLDVLTEGNLVISFSLSFLFGCLSGSMCNLLLSNIRSERGAMLNYYFLTFAFNVLIIFIDIGLFEQGIIALTIVFFITSFLIKFYININNEG